MLLISDLIRTFNVNAPKEEFQVFYDLMKPGEKTIKMVDVYDFVLTLSQYYQVDHLYKLAKLELEKAIKTCAPEDLCTLCERAHLLDLSDLVKIGMERCAMHLSEINIDDMMSDDLRLNLLKKTQVLAGRQRFRTPWESVVNKEKYLVYKKVMADIMARGGLIFGGAASW